MNLLHIDEYERYGLDVPAIQRLALLGDLVQSAPLNVTSVKESAEIECKHFLDSLSLLSLPVVTGAKRLIDVGSGGGFPALVLALALPGAHVVALESVHKKCDYIRGAAQTLGLSNVEVTAARAEEHGAGAGREAYDLAVTRAVGPLAVVAEYSLPLLVVGGTMVAMKGLISDQERIQGQHALGILGADGLDAVRLDPYIGSENRWAYVARKVRPTSAEFPRRSGVPARKPLGSLSQAGGI